MSMDEAQGSHGSDEQPVRNIRASYVPVFELWVSPKVIVGFIDVNRCEYLRATGQPGSVGDVVLCRTPRGFYLEYVKWSVIVPHTENRLQRSLEYTVFVHPRGAAKWFVLTPEE